MNSGEPGRVIASAFALAGFAVALIGGVSAGNSAVAVIRFGLGAMVLCYITGWLIGSVASSVVNEHLRARSAEASAPRQGVERAGSVETTS